MICMIVNICPESVDEVFALIPGDGNGPDLDWILLIPDPDPFFLLRSRSVPDPSDLKMRDPDPDPSDPRVYGSGPQIPLLS
ncbi:hypothetical protein OROMI_022618 [Orobanche minor]